MMRRSRLVAATVFALGCAALQHTVAVDPEATFAAHREHAGMVIDRLGRDGSGTLAPAGWFRRPGDPTFVLRADGAEVAAYWLSGRRVVVRRTAEEGAPAVGEIDPAWDDGGAIRLSLTGAEGSALRTDAFARQMADTGPATLTRASQTVIDVRGTYRATLRDGQGAPVGWLRVRVGPYLPAPRIFDGALPAAVDPALAVGAAVALDAEIDWIESHTVDVYRGDGGGALERSVPVRR
jgi:hypothetical protein